MHLVAVLALPNVVLFDLAVPVECLRRVRLPDGSPAYDVQICGLGPVRAAGVEITPTSGLDLLAVADTIVIPGVEDIDAPTPAPVLDALRAAAAAGTRVVSICSGAFPLAETGLLDGLRATTHWLAAGELARRHPKIDVDPMVLYVDNGQILTSAGAAAGMDLCLHLVRRDLGAAAAVEASRLAVMPLERSGGQAQFIVHAVPEADGASLEPLLRWMTTNLHQPLTVPSVARRAAMSTRTLIRRFREQTGTSPMQWLQRARVRRAQHLLETTDHAIERVAEQVGFGSVSAFRERFRAEVGASPTDWRRTYRADVG